MASEEAAANKGPSLDEISKLRGSAQEKSMETIRAAEERYHKAKETGGGRSEEETGPSLEEISKMRGAAQENSMEAIRAAEERYHKVNETPHKPK